MRFLHPVSAPAVIAAIVLLPIALLGLELGSRLDSPGLDVAAASERHSDRLGDPTAYAAGILHSQERPYTTTTTTVVRRRMLGEWPWDALARCESNQTWDANTGNGYYGGLQFSHQTWVQAGGRRFSEYPHHATREQQIAIARSWLAKTSWAQWPTCSRILGLR